MKIMPAFGIGFLSRHENFGSSGYVIPDELCGEHQVYREHWRFHIRHRTMGDKICVSWSVTNLVSEQRSSELKLHAKRRSDKLPIAPSANRCLEQHLKCA